MWTVRFDADVNSLKRTDVDDARDLFEAKRTGLMYKTTLGTRKVSVDIVDRDAAKRLRHTGNQPPRSSSAVPYQIETPVSSISQHGKHDTIAGMSA